LQLIGSDRLRWAITEIAELELPVRFERYVMAPDTGGAGRYRGGLGQVREVRFLARDATLEEMDLPALLAREAAAVDLLAGGRLILGVGAGWNVPEHEAFGIPFPSLKERFDNLESGIDRIHLTWEMSNPKPPRDGRVPLLIGGGGEKRTLGLAARHAAEWNLNPIDLDAFRSKSAILDGYCRDLGRDPTEIRRSVMCVALVGRDRDELHQRAGALGQVIPRYREMKPDEVVAAVAERGLAGTVEQVVERVRAGAAAGVQLFCCQHFLLDDRDHLRALAEVAKAVG